jgi:hypothetical protein
VDGAEGQVCREMTDLAERDRRAAQLIGQFALASTVGWNRAADQQAPAPPAGRLAVVFGQGASRPAGNLEFFAAVSEAAPFPCLGQSADESTWSRE